MGGRNEYMGYILTGIKIIMVLGLAYIYSKIVEWVFKLMMNDVDKIFNPFLKVIIILFFLAILIWISLVIGTELSGFFKI